MTEFHIDRNDLDWLRRLARALVNEGSSADDLVQDTVLAALRRPPDGVSQDRGRRRAWLGSVARRLAARSFRDRTRRQRRERVVARPESEVSTEALVARAEFAERLVQRVRELKEPIRTTVLLHFLDGRTTAEIAARTGEKPDTIRWRIRHGVERLRARIASEEPGGWASGLGFLLPLAEASRTTTTVVASTPTLALSTGLFVKSTSFVPSLVIALGLLFVLIGPFGSSREVDPSEGAPPRSVTNKAMESLPSRGQPAVAGGTGIGVRVDADPAPDDSRTQSRGDLEAIGNRWSGRVTTTTGRPIAGAIVFVHDEEQVRERTAAPRRTVRTGEDGRFVIAFDPTADPPAELSVVQNGFLRRDVTEVPADGDFGTIQLDRGHELVGRVVDRFAQPVGGLRLAAVTDGESISHVSPTQMVQRADRARVWTSQSTYRDSVTVTETDGTFLFTGLPARPLSILSLDPGWAIVGPSVLGVRDAAVEVTVRRRLGVRLDVFEAGSTELAGKVRAIFRVELELSDGTTEAYGQWVGRGTGSVLFALDDGMIPDLGEKRITRARFYGVVGHDGRESDWSSDPITDTFGPSRVARARAELPALAAIDDPEHPAKLGRVLLDVRDEANRLIDAPLSVSWSLTLQDGRAIRDSVRIEPDGTGRHELELPVGRLELRVHPFGRSGSLPSWTGELIVMEGRTVPAFATVPVGATARITRPTDWRGSWIVHASYRDSSGEDWFGSWNYGTDEDVLVLQALRGAEWRFVLSQPGENGPREEVRIVRVATGQVVDVDGR